MIAWLCRAPVRVQRSSNMSRTDRYLCACLRRTVHVRTSVRMLACERKGVRWIRNPKRAAERDGRRVVRMHASVIPDIERQDIVAGCQLNRVDHTVQRRLPKDRLR